MHQTPVLCTNCGSDVTDARATRISCPDCHAPLDDRPDADEPPSDTYQEPAQASTPPPTGSVADPFGDYPEPAYEPPEAPPGPVPPSPPPTSSGAGRWLARRGIWWLVGLAIFGVIRWGPGIWTDVREAFGGAERDSTGEVVEAGTASAFDIRVGDCFNVPAIIGSVEEAELVPCADPHLYEAYAAYVYPDKANAEYPGLDAIIDAGDEYCFDEFEDFVDARWETSALDFAYLYPEPEGWRFGDRTILCFLAAVDESMLTGSMQGTKA